MNSFLKPYQSWTVERISRHLVYWGAWTVFFPITNFLLGGTFTLLQWFLFELLVLPIKIGCAYTFAYWLLPRFLYRKKYFSFIVFSFVTWVLFSTMLILMYQEVIYPYLLRYPIYNGFYHDAIYWCVELFYISGFISSIKFFQNILQQQQKQYELKQEKTQTELKYLKNQVQPHFLFNTLNNLYGMVISKDDNAANAIIKLSDMLSYMLYESEDNLVPLHKEIDHLDNYIALERLRYNRKLSLYYEKPEFPDHLMVAPLLFIPFVENAFKHGPAKEEKRSEILIQFELQNEELTLMVKNTYNDTNLNGKVKPGIGLSNVRKRLALTYPGQHSLHIKQDHYFEVVLTLALSSTKKIIHAETEMHYH